MSSLLFFFYGLLCFTVHVIMSLILYIIAPCSLLDRLYLSLPAIGHCISVLLASLQRWTSKPVQRVSLLTLLALAMVGEKAIQLFTGEVTSLRTPITHTLSVSLSLSLPPSLPPSLSEPTSNCTLNLNSDLSSLLALVGGDRGRGKDSNSGKKKYRRGVALASFLPGLTMALTKLLTTDANIGQVRTCMCNMYVVYTYMYMYLFIPPSLSLPLSPSLLLSFPPYLPPSLPPSLPPFFTRQ